MAFLKKYSLLLLLLAFAGYFLGRYFYFMPKYSNGNPAPTFAGKLLGGDDFQLSDLQGQYVLLDFWGSWCGPCRRANPYIKALYDKYQNANFTDGQNFTIVSIGVEKSERSWQNAIIQDQLEWPYHVLDLSENLRFFNSPIAQTYSIKEVPTTYLINPVGDIIGVNVAPDQIDRLLASKLSK